MANIDVEEILVDFGKICRLCLSDQGCLISLFPAETSYDSERFSVVIDRIYRLMSIMINENDDYPTWICHNCLSQVDRSFEFFESCVNAQDTLYQSFVDALSNYGIEENDICDILKKRGIHGQKKPEKEVKEEPRSDEPVLLQIKEEYSNDNGNLFLLEVEQKDDIGVSKNSCTDCSIGFKTKEALFIHRVSVHHDDLVSDKVKTETQDQNVCGQWTCDTCGAKFRSKNAITTHIRSKHLRTVDANMKKSNEALIFCKFCGSSFSKKNSQRHMERVHKVPKLESSNFDNYDCQLCFRPFHKASSLRNHIEKDHKDDLESFTENDNCRIVWSCNECDSIFPEEVYLIQHYGNKHSKYPVDVRALKVLKDKSLICECGLISSELYEAVIHKLFDHDYISYSESIECLFCMKTFGNIINLKKHMVSCHWFVTSTYDNECCLCNKEFLSHNNLRLHMTRVHDVSFEETAPLKTNVSQEGEEKAEKKIRRSNSNESCVCEYCGNDYRNASALEKHIVNCPSNGCHKCSKCDKSYKTENHLRRHITEYHNTLEPIKCPDCYKIFPRKMNLHNHYKRRHLKQIKKYVCSFCGFALKGRVALKSHEDRLHRNIRNFKCPHCPDSFTTRNILKKHVLRHMKNRPMHYCHFCEKKFSTISGIERHLKLHEGVKDFVCQITKCAKAFYTKNELRRHMKYHTRDFQHQCSVCSRRFVSPGDLKKHSTKHTGEKPYKCPVCPSAYSRRDDKVKHLKRVHNLRVKRIYGKPLRKNPTDPDYVEIDELDTIVIDEESPAFFENPENIYVTEQEGNCIIVANNMKIQDEVVVG